MCVCSARVCGAPFGRQPRVLFCVLQTRPVDRYPATSHILTCAYPSSVSLCVPSVPSGLYPASSCLPLPQGRLSPVSVHFSFLTSLSCSCVFVWPFTPRAYTRRLCRTSCLPVHPACHAPRDWPRCCGRFVAVPPCSRAGASALRLARTAPHSAVCSFPPPVPSVHTPCSGQTSLFTWLPSLPPGPARFPSPEMPGHCRSQTRPVSPG